MPTEEQIDRFNAQDSFLVSEADRLRKKLEEEEAKARAVNEPVKAFAPIERVVGENEFEKSRHPQREPERPGFGEIKFSASGAGKEPELKPELKSQPKQAQKGIMTLDEEK